MGQCSLYAPRRAGSGSVGFCLLIGPWLNYFSVQSQSAGAFWLFVKPPLLDTIQIARQDFAKNKYALELSEKGRFFFSKPFRARS
ncbi:hypothetical protein AB669_04145 [Pedobacter sp. BMA]|nr:hypothetical protein AB669_04145 [Pedobacter sp. BMA]